MAKARITTSGNLIKDCFIEIRGKTSFKSFTETGNSDDDDDEDHVVSNIQTKSSTTENNIFLKDETSGLNKADDVEEEGPNDSEDSVSSESRNIQRPGERNHEDEIGDEDKSDYCGESFCTDDSCKGSEVTIVTPRSSLSGCSSLLNSSGIKYDQRMTDLIKSRRSGDRHRKKVENGSGMSLLENEMKYLNEEERMLMIDRRQLTHSGRRNMSFTNEEMRKIERENQLLLKKIMSYQKPQNKSVKPLGFPRTSSSAINRKRQQKKIEEDNMILLRRIQQAKPCAMTRTSGSGCRLAAI